MDTRSFSTLARTSAIAACACHDFAAEFVIGDKEFVGQFDGSIATRLGKPHLSSDGLTTVPLHVIGYTTSSNIPGMGHTTLDFDFSRPVAASDVAAGHKSEFFPGTQTMRLQILVTTDAFKGKLLRSMSASALQNTRAQDFPPPAGSTYTLGAPVLLEDIANPGTPLATLKTVNTRIVSTTVAPDRITTNKGFVLHAKAGKTAIVDAEKSEAEIAYESSLGGTISLELFDQSEKSIGVAFLAKRADGRGSVRVPNSLWQGRATYYQISIDGLPRTSLMPME